LAEGDSTFQVVAMTSSSSLVMNLGGWWEPFQFLYLRERPSKCKKMQRKPFIDQSSAPDPNGELTLQPETPIWLGGGLIAPPHQPHFSSRLDLSGIWLRPFGSLLTTLPSSFFTHLTLQATINTKHEALTWTRGNHPARWLHLWLIYHWISDSKGAALVTPSAWTPESLAP